jgi:2-dehydro-3-deoxygalactonokinase
MVSPAGDAPQLIGLDWGTSSVRAFLMRDGKVIDTRTSADGVQALAGGGEAAFERAFAALARPWLQNAPATPVVACGMVGSAQGWREAPYLDCPADAAALARHAATLRSAGGATIRIAPGVRHLPGAGRAPDVMRGEETQVFGALACQPAWRQGACFVLPGTHSKWVTLRDGRIEALATYMTGELFALLRTHSILGRLMPAGSDATAAGAPGEGFERGLHEARAALAPGELLHALFSVRTRGLMQQLCRRLLIGSELGAAFARESSSLPLVLVGEPALCRRYADALRLWQRPPAACLDNTAPAGLWSLAVAAGWLAR